MIIVPRLKVGSVDPELLPIRVILQTRMDAIVVILRVIRYLSSVGVYGESLKWFDSKDSPIFINKVGEDPYDNANSLPSMTVDIGGYRIPDDKFLYENAIKTNQEGTDFYSELNTGVEILIKGRSDKEVYNLADNTADFLKVLKPDILGSVENLDGIFSITAGRVVPTTDASATPGRYECMVTMNIRAYKYLNWSRYKGPGDSPDPVLNKGIHMGTGGIQSRLNPEGTRPLFSYSSFVVTAGSSDADAFVVTNQTMFSGREGVATPQDLDTATQLSFSSKEFDLGEVPPESGESELGISMTTQKDGNINIVFPEFIEVDLPGFSLVHDPGTITVRLRG
jgi:hypothetical protein